MVGNRMDYFLRKHTKPDYFWQDITDSIVDFKPKNKELLAQLPKTCNVVCFHGKPRIQEATYINWVNNYVNL
jgi:hypothetical protein